VAIIGTVLKNPEGKRMPLTYAVGDVHGSLDMLKALIEGCRQHADGRALQLVFLGDYIDRGPESAGVVRHMLRLQDELQDRLIALRGNHEAFVLGLLDGAVPLAVWLRNGGVETLASYGVREVGDLPRPHLDWMRALRLSYDDGRRFFVHAGVDPQKPLDAQDEQDLLWIREPFLSDRRDYGRLIVHGHTPVESATPDLRANRLNLDTAAVYGGALTAAVFDDTQTEPLAYLQAR
jgi:diadenosine tetraphosphatase ApaH/serine/threonine PP2A family protein phosphatase